MINIFLSLEQYNSNHIIFFEKMKNNIIENGYFIKLIYSTMYFSLNGIYLHIPFIDIKIDNGYNKNKGYFDTQLNKNIMEKLQNIEINILNKMNTDKRPVYKIYDNLKNGNFKIYYNDCLDTNIILKISGIWISGDKYGLTYKFNNFNHL
jgi:hypothetical protein